MTEAEADPFYELIGPARDSLTAMVVASRQRREEAGLLPAADSPAMGELARESELAGEWGDDPLKQAHVLGSLLITHAEDCAAAMCRDLVSDPVPTWASGVLARSAIESASRAYRVFEVGIGDRARVARAMTERIYSINEQLKMLEGSEEAQRTSLEERVRRISSAGEAHAFELVGKPVALDEVRPKGTQVVSDCAGALGDAGLGASIFKYYSAVTHATAYALNQNVTLVVDNLAGSLGEVAVYPEDVELPLGMTSLVLGVALEAEGQLFGWPVDAVNEARDRRARTGWSSAGRQHSHR